MAKQTSYRLVKIHRSYTVNEAARLTGSCKGTVRRWIKNGLPALQSQKPIIIKGADLREYLKGKSKPKQKCALDECHCFKCKSNQKLAFGEAEIVFDKSPAPNMRGLCGTCSTLMHKRISNAAIPDLEAKLQITFRQADEPISNRTKPRSNEHLQKEKIQ